MQASFENSLWNFLSADAHYAHAIHFPKFISTLGTRKNALNIPSNITKTLFPLAIVAGGALVVFLIHWFFGGTCLAFEQLEHTVRYHSEHHFFTGRKFTSEPVVWLSSVLSIRAGIVFIVYSFGFLSLIGGILWFASKREKHLSGGMNVWSFFLSFPVLFLFFTPVYGYDEPVQWLFALSGILLLAYRKLVPAVLFFMLATLARESTLFLLPAFLWMLSRQYELRSRQLIVSALVILSGALLYRWGTAETSHLSELYERGYHLAANFESFDRTFESLFSMLCVLLIPIYVVVTPKRRNWSLNGVSLYNPLVITLIVNTVLVFFTGYAREARLFALPWLFIWPVFSQLTSIRMRSGSVKSKHSDWYWLLAAITLVGMYFAVSVLYHPTIGSGGDGLFLIHFLISAAFVFVDAYFLKRSNIGS